MQYFAVTNVGKVRKNNEDYYLHPGMPVAGIGAKDIEHHGLLYIVCDGVGGHASGEVASREAARYLFDNWYSTRHGGLEDGERLGRLIRETNARILDVARQNPAHAGMASTLVAMLVKGTKGFVANIGDSRAYRFNGSTLSQITKDHSYKQELYDAGEISRQELSSFPFGNLITRALGFDVAAHPDIFRLDLVEGECYLLCTDGLSDLVTDRMIRNILAKDISLEGKANALVQKALVKGGDDNVTVVVLGS